MPRGFYAIISRCGAARKPGSGNGNPVGAWTRPQGRGRRGLRPRRPAPTGQRSPPGAAGGSASKRGKRAGARPGARPRARDLLRGSNGAARGDSRAGQRARGAHNNAQARRHFYAATPEPVRRPPMMCPRRRAASIAARSTGTRRPDGTPAARRAMP